MTVRDLKVYLDEFEDNDNVLIQRIEYNESFPDNIIAIRKINDEIILIGEQYQGINI